MPKRIKTTKQMIDALLVILNKNDYHGGVRQLATKKRAISKKEHSDLMETLDLVTVGSMKSYIENFRKKGEKYLNQKDQTKSFDAKLFFTDPLRLGILASTVVAMGTGPFGVALLLGAMPSLSYREAIGWGLVVIGGITAMLAGVFSGCGFSDKIIKHRNNPKKNNYEKTLISLKTKVSWFFNKAEKEFGDVKPKTVVSLFSVRKKP